MTDHLEVVLFTVREGERDAFLAKRPAVLALLSGFEGFVDARLAEYEDGTWIDVVQWRSLEAAKAAAETFMEHEAARDWGQHIDEVRDFRHAALHHLHDAAAL
jgi:heme-degrading monooxygenase HmoA